MGIVLLVHPCIAACRITCFPETRPRHCWPRAGDGTRTMAHHDTNRPDFPDNKSMRQADYQCRLMTELRTARYVDSSSAFRTRYLRVPIKTSAWPSAASRRNAPV